MPDLRSHRGAHPEDAQLFNRDRWPVLQNAARELWWLLDRGYALRSSLALVGDRHELRQRQRLALARGSCTAAQVGSRASRHVVPLALQGAELWIDGYNQLITLEAALAGGILIRGRDGCCRDMASLHGSYRRVEETVPALKLLGAWQAVAGVSTIRWILDRPVANSGRLRALIEELARESGWNWIVALEPSPDAVLTRSPAVVASSDSVVLDRCERWCNVTDSILQRLDQEPEVLVLAS